MDSILGLLLLPVLLPYWLLTGAADYPKALLIPQRLSQASMVPLLS